MRQKNKRNTELVYSPRTQDRILDHRIYDLKLSHITIDFSLMSHDMQWIHKGSSCILL